MQRDSEDKSVRMIGDNPIGAEMMGCSKKNIKVILNRAVLN